MLEYLDDRLQGGIHGFGALLEGQLVDEALENHLCASPFNILLWVLQKGDIPRLCDEDERRIVGFLRTLPRDCWPDPLEWRLSRV